jgi:hypothetical protein
VPMLMLPTLLLLLVLVLVLLFRSPAARLPA